MAEKTFTFIEGEDLQAKSVKKPEAFRRFADYLAEADTLVKVGEAGRDAIQGVLGDELRRVAEYNDKVIMRAIIKNRAAAIEVDGKLAAFGAYMGWAQEGFPERTLNGRKIYMLTKGTTLPGFEGRGFNKALRKRRIEMITEEDPNGYILVITKEKRIKDQCGPEWERSTMTEMLDRCDSRNCTQKLYDGYKEAEKKEGYEAFLLDPRKHQAE
jgi:hypothetical protein